MDYYKFQFRVKPAEDYQLDLLTDALGQVGFDTFEETEGGLDAYMPTSNFEPDRLEEVLAVYREMFPISYDQTLIAQKNWNTVWESNFEPIAIGSQIFVRATFHDSRPGFPYEIVIDPKMAFGTGHHHTTALMLELMLNTDLKNKKVLDMGCGTGILAIMAAKLGATDITAIDFDPVCYDSTIENASLNQVESIRVLCGSKEAIPVERFDIILANINRNILLDQIERYSQALAAGGEIYFSGFYESPDLEIIKDEAARYGLKYATHQKSADWVAAKFTR